MSIITVIGSTDEESQILNKLDSLHGALIALEKAIEYNPCYQDATDLINLIQRNIASRYSMGIYRWTVYFVFCFRCYDTNDLAID